MLAAIAPVAIVLAPLLALPVSAVQRLAAVAVRDGIPRWPAAWHELRRRPRRKLAIATIQLLVTALGLINVLVSVRLGGLLGAASTIAAAYALLAIWALATALWPILSDPRCDAPLGRQLRLAAALALGRPLAIGLLLLLAIVAVLVCVRLVAPAFVLPSLVLLVIAAYVGDAADQLHTVSTAEAGARTDSN